MPKTFDDYAADLKALVAEASEAILADNDPDMKSAHDELEDFISASDDNVHGVIELDTVATSTMRDLALARLEQSLGSNVSDRSADIARLIKTFSTQASVNNSAASAIKLERVKALLDASTTAVSELKKFADTVDTSNPDGKKIAKALGDAVAAVLAVQKQIAG